jgi:general stress protein YciG
MSPDITGQEPHTTEKIDARIPRPRGFAAMDRELVKDIGRRGGRAAHSKGKAHEFTSDEAREAGRKGGRATHAKRTEASRVRRGEANLITSAHGPGFQTAR